MTNLTKKNYYDDKTHISNSMLSNLINYERGTRIVTPDTYYAYHISQRLKFEPTDAMLCGTIVDRCFSEGPEILMEYTPVARRTGKVANEITNGMHEKVTALIQTFNAFKSFQDFINLPDTKAGTHEDAVVTGLISLPSGRQVRMKAKLDFINPVTKQFIDQKTCANVNTLFQELQWQGVCNIYHRYIRQMTLYWKLTGFAPALAIGDEEGRMLFLPIEQYILEKCWEVYERDLETLMDYYEADFKNMIQNPFLPFPETDITPLSDNEI